MSYKLSWEYRIHIDKNQFIKLFNILSFKKNDFEKKIITSEFKSEDKYYYYSYLFDENNNLIEIFEIVDPEKNNLFRNLETKEEEQQ